MIRKESNAGTLNKHPFAINLAAFGILLILLLIKFQMLRLQIKPL